jgi:RNA polymerase sigma factor (sigma-70 family)
VKVVTFPARPVLGPDREAARPSFSDHAQPIAAETEASNAGHPERTQAAEPIPATTAEVPAPQSPIRRTARRKKRRGIKQPAAVAVLARTTESPTSIRRNTMLLLAHVFDLKSAPAVARPAEPEREATAVSSDKQKVAEARATADAVFWPVWLTHRDYLYRYSLRFSNGNAADAEDAMGEAMLKAVEAFPHAEIRNHRAWLLRLVHNACMDRYRVKERQNRLMSDMANDDGQSVPAVAPKPNRSPEELLGAVQLITCLQDAMMTLPRSLAEPLLLYLDDLSDADIAASLNVTKEVIRKRRQMARDWLRRRLLP